MNTHSSIPKQLLFMCDHHKTPSAKIRHTQAREQANKKLKLKLKQAILYCDTHLAEPHALEACEVLWEEIDDLAMEILKNM
jgi:hypothetical protein